MQEIQVLLEDDKNILFQPKELQIDHFYILKNKNRIPIA